VNDLCTHFEKFVQCGFLILGGASCSAAVSCVTKPLCVTDGGKIVHESGKLACNLLVYVSSNCEAKRNERVGVAGQKNVHR